MTTETMKQEIAELEEQGWEADAAPRAVEKHYRFPDFHGTKNFLIALEKEAAAQASAMPSIHIEDGTEVRVRIGGPPVRTLTAAEIAFAKAVSNAQ